MSEPSTAPRLLPSGVQTPTLKSDSRLLPLGVWTPSTGELRLPPRFKEKIDPKAIKASQTSFKGIEV